VINDSSNPPSSNQSFELTPVGSDVESGGGAALPEEAIPDVTSHTKIHIEEVQ
jgi:hypothetical protein